MGFTQPQVILVGRDEPIKAQIVEDLTKSGFYAPFNRQPDNISDAQWVTLTERAKKVVGGDVIPAYQRFLDFYQNEYMPGARETLGAYQLPGGEGFLQRSDPVTMRRLI